MLTQLSVGCHGVARSHIKEKTASTQNCPAILGTVLRASPCATLEVDDRQVWWLFQRIFPLVSTWFFIGSFAEANSYAILFYCIPIAFHYPNQLSPDNLWWVTNRDTSVYLPWYPGPKCGKWNLFRWSWRTRWERNQVRIPHKLPWFEHLQPQVRRRRGAVES